MNIQFVHPWILYLLWLPPLLGALWILLFRRKQDRLADFVASPMLERLAPPRPSRRFYWQMAFFLPGFLLLLLALARPQWGLEQETLYQRGRDLMIALDVSRSMLATDVHPSRLQRAKADVIDLVRSLQGDRAGLIAFRGKALQVCPLTSDYAYLEQAVDALTPDSAPRGETDIGDAVTKALTAFETDEGSHRALILISDGEDLAGHAKAAAEEAAKRGIVIFTVGLGSTEGAAIPDPQKAGRFLSYQNEEVKTRLDSHTLRALADITGGGYVPVGTANVRLGSLYQDHLSKIQARDFEETARRRFVERYAWFLFPAFLAFLVAAMLSRGRMASRSVSERTSNQGINQA